MPTKNFLSLEEKQYLQNTLKQEQRAEVREKFNRCKLNAAGLSYFCLILDSTSTH